MTPRMYVLLIAVALFVIGALQANNSSLVMGTMWIVGAFVAVYAVFVSEGDWIRHRDEEYEE